MEKQKGLGVVVATPSMLCRKRQADLPDTDSTMKTRIPMQVGRREGWRFKGTFYITEYVSLGVLIPISGLHGT